MWYRTLLSTLLQFKQVVILAVFLFADSECVLSVAGCDQQVLLSCMSGSTKAAAQGAVCQVGAGSSSHAINSSSTQRWRSSNSI
jgi:hypothetical protein